MRAPRFESQGAPLAPNLRDRSLITGGGGAQNGRGGGGASEVLPLQKGSGAGKVLAMLKGESLTLS